MVKTLWIWMALALPALALIFRDGPSPAANTETAPTGAYADSGWQYQIRYGAFHGTIISPKHFITAVHLGGSQIPSQPAHFNGVEERFYGIMPDSRVVLGTTDLAVFEIWETFDDYAPLYTKVNEAGKELVISGRGLGRGTELTDQGWKWGAEATRKSRWGRNVIGGVGATSNGDNLLYFGFDDLLGQDEVAATSGDSGGGWFIKDGPTWKLAAVSFSVDGNYSEAAVPSDTNDFRGSFFDAGGLSWGSDARGWDLLPTTGSSTSPLDLEFYRQSHTYGSRISSNLSQINPVISSALAWEGLSFDGRFGSWLTEFGVAGATGTSDDADGDGRTNLEEYLSESDPSDGSEAISPLELSFLSDGTHQFTLVESLDLAGRGLTATLQSSENLGTWTTVNDVVEFSNTRDHAEGIRMKVLTRTPFETGDLYYRLKITLASP